MLSGISCYWCLTRIVPVLQQGSVCWEEGREEQCVFIDSLWHVYKNEFESVITQEINLDLTEAMLLANIWLKDHFGFVILIHNEHLLKRLCNYKLFLSVFNKMNLEIILSHKSTDKCNICYNKIKSNENYNYH